MTPAPWSIREPVKPLEIDPETLELLRQRAELERQILTFYRIATLREGR